LESFGLSHEDAQDRDKIKNGQPGLSWIVAIKTCVCVIDIAAAEAIVSHLIVEQNGSDFLVRWNLEATAVNVTDIFIVWCTSHSPQHGCEV